MGAFANILGDRIKTQIDAYIAGLADPKYDNLDRQSLLRALASAWEGGVKTVSGGNYNIVDTDWYAVYDVEGSRIITLPTIADNWNKFYFIRKYSNDYNLVTVSGEGAETINGSNSHYLGNQYNYIGVYADQTRGEWVIVCQSKVRSGARATLNANQLIADITVSPVIFTTEVFDILSEHSTVTGVFTVKKSNIYQIDVSVLFEAYAWAAGKIAYMDIYYDSAQYSRLDRQFIDVAGTYNIRLHGNDKIQAAAGSTIDIRVWHNRGAGSNLINSSTYNYFSIYGLD